MKFIISLFILFFFSVCENYEDQFNWSYAEKKWTEANMIEKKITGAAIVEKSFNVLDYKIIPDGNTINTNLINNLIDTVSQEGGGRINFPSGTYLTGGLILKNNIEIHLEHDAILKFSQNPVDYTPNVIGHWEGMEINNFRAFIYSNGAENIAITGNGILDGNAGWDNWWDWSKKNLHKLDKNRPRLMGYNRDQVDVSERNFGLGYNLRPNFIQLYKSKNITIKDVTLKNSPMWNILMSHLLSLYFLIY